MAQKKAPPAKGHSLVKRFNGSFVVAVSAVVSYGLHAKLSSSLYAAWTMCGFNVALCLVLSLLTCDYSWVDRLWSVVPAFYVLHFASSAGFDARTSAMAALATLWGLRLSYNFARKDGYQVRDNWLQRAFITGDSLPPCALSDWRAGLPVA